MRRWTTALAALLLVALPTVAQAQNYTTRTGNLGVSDPTPAAGQTITVNGSGYAGNASVTITMESQPVTLKTTTANAAGQLNTQITIPSNTTPGQHTLRATGRSSDGGTLVLSASIVVSSAGSTGQAALPRTGPTSAVGMAGIGLLLAASGALVFTMRSRKVTADNLFGGNLFRW